MGIGKGHPADDILVSCEFRIQSRHMRYRERNTGRGSLSQHRELPERHGSCLLMIEEAQLQRGGSRRIPPCIFPICLSSASCTIPDPGCLSWGSRRMSGATCDVVLRARLGTRRLRGCTHLHSVADGIGVLILAAVIPEESLHHEWSSYWLEAVVPATSV